MLPLLLLAAVATGQDIDPPVFGQVDVDSAPRGAELFAGDSLLGTTPVRVPRRLVRDIVAYYPSRRSWNAQTAVLPDDLPAAGDGVALLRFERRVTLRTLPHGARVFRGQTMIGTTPLAVAGDTGPLRIEALGYRGTDWDPASVSGTETLIMLDSMGEGGRVDVRAAGEAFRLPPADVLLPAGVGLAAGVAAVILKQKADAYYDDYLASGDDSLLSQTKKYDIYAGVSLAILQLGLGYFIYRLFDE